MRGKPATKKRLMTIDKSWQDVSTSFLSNSNVVTKECLMAPAHAKARSECSYLSNQALVVRSDGELGWGRTWDGWRRDLGDESGIFVLENEADKHKCDRDKRGDAERDGLCRVTQQAVVGVAVVVDEDV